MFRAINKKFLQDNIHNLREHSWKFILATYSVYWMLLIFIIFIVYAYNLLDFIQIQTFNIIHLTLISSLFLFVIVILLMVKNIGKINAVDIGLKKNQVKEGLIFYGLVYIILNLILLLLNISIIGTINLDPYWNEQGLLYAVGALIAQVFGNVLIEETYYRGYLFNQLTKKFYTKKHNSEFQSLLFSVLLSSVMFAIMHIPIRLYNGITGLNLLLSLFNLIGTGAFFAVIYILSNNLFIVMVIHIIGNISFVLFSPIYDAGIIGWAVSVLLIICMLLYKKKKGQLT